MLCCILNLPNRMLKSAFLLFVLLGGGLKNYGLYKNNALFLMKCPPPISTHSIAGIPSGKSDASGGIDFPGGIPAYTIEQRSGGPVQSVVVVVVGGGGYS